MIYFPAGESRRITCGVMESGMAGVARWKTTPHPKGRAMTPTAAIDPHIETLVRKLLIASPIARHLGITVTRLAPGDVRLRLPFAMENVTVDRIVHGGVIATLADIAGAAASFSGVDPTTARGGATQTLVVNYLRPADGCDLETSTRVLSRSRSGTVTSVEIHDPDGQLIAQATVTSRIW
ncbi:MAG TPA: acyl-CoA thioesterase [Tistrella mobilis]|uniref:Acyl-CoA thioesterase n=2 Tax=Tistrella TaxID=171436 RepID=A0A3B9IM88_9PROT|nr:acyl-CoA thioesterase [Tistrella mobilis]